MYLVDVANESMYCHVYNIGIEYLISNNFKFKLKAGVKGIQLQKNFTILLVS